MRLRENLAGNVKRIRRDRKMSQDEFAALIGIHRTYQNHIEHAKRSPTIDVIERMMDALDVDVTDLLGELPQKP